MIIDIGFRPRRWQARVLRSLKRFSVLIVHRRGGKTVLAVVKLIDAALRCKLDMGRFGYVAPLLKQAREIAWDYLKAYTAEIPGVQINESRLSVTFPNGARVTLYGADNPDAIRGGYFDGVVMDELAQMRPQVWGEVIRPMLVDRNGWALFIGTPKGINLLSELYFRARSLATWFADLLTVHDTDTISPEEIEQARREMSEAEFDQEMLCSFHAGVSNALMSLADVEAAYERQTPQSAWNWSPRIMGVDYAWEGNDSSCIGFRQGIKLHDVERYRDKDPPEFAGIVIERARQWHPAAIPIDVGFAPGVFTIVRNAGLPAMPVKFGGKATDQRFENKRAEIWFTMAEWLKTADIEHRNPDLWRDLCAPTYKPNRHGKILLESKEDMRSRGLPSPDFGDAVACTFAFNIAAAAATRRGVANHDYDPTEALDREAY